MGEYWQKKKMILFFDFPSILPLYLHNYHIHHPLKNEQEFHLDQIKVKFFTAFLTFRSPMLTFLSITRTFFFLKFFDKINEPHAFPKINDGKKLIFLIIILSYTKFWEAKIYSNFINYLFWTEYSKFFSSELQTFHFLMMLTEENFFDDLIFLWLVFFLLSFLKLDVVYWEHFYFC